MNIQEARVYLDERVFMPALASPTLTKEIKHKLKVTRSRTNQFRCPGDLLHYISRHQETEGPEDPIHEALRLAGLRTFEDIYPEFRRDMGVDAEDHFGLQDFVTGEVYTAFDVSSLADVYNPQQGILPVGDPPHRAILIKVTLEGGRYANKWLIPNEKLKYYFFSRAGLFKLEYEFNQAIINSANAPIYAFIKEGDNQYRFNGLFRYVGHHIEDGGRRWFELDRIPAVAEDVARRGTARRVTYALSDDPDRRRSRLADAPRIPRRVITQHTDFVRNPDVIADVLERALGICERCGNKAPFTRKSDGTPYLEVHHKIMLAEGGEDTVQNAVALCPNCHRMAHYGDEPIVWG